MMKATTIFDILNRDIFICILNEWLSSIGEETSKGVQDIVNFDSALCSANVRSIYLSLTNKQLRTVHFGNGCRSFSQFIEWKISRHFQVFSLTLVYSNNIHTFAMETFLMMMVHCCELRILNLTLFVQRDHILNTTKIDIKQLLLSLPKLEDLVIKFIYDSSKKWFNNLTIPDDFKVFDEVQKNESNCTTPTFPLQSLQFLSCCADSSTYLNILSWLQYSCKLLRFLNFKLCYGMFLPFVANVLSCLPSLETFEYSQFDYLVEDYSSEKYKCLKCCGNNENNLVDTTLQQYHYDLPKLKKVMLTNCGKVSDIVVSILAGAVNLEEILISWFFESAPKRLQQVMSILAMYAKTTLRVLYVDGISDIFFDQLQPNFQYPTSTLVLANQRNFTDSMILIISRNMLKLEQLHFFDISDDIPDSAINSFVESPQCFTHLKSLVIFDVCIKKELLINMISKCVKLQQLNLDFDGSGFGSEFFLELIKLPIVRQLNEFDIEMDRCFPLTHILTKDLLNELVESWNFSLLKHCKITGVLMNKTLYCKILDSPLLLSYHIDDCKVPYKILNKTKTVQFKILCVKGNNSDEIKHQRMQQFFKMLSDNY